MLLNLMQNNLVALRKNVESDSIIREPKRALTGTGMDHRIEHFGAKRVRYQNEQKTTAMTKRDVVVSCSPSCLLRG